MTIRKIAAQAGVAASTVSLVLNNKPGVKKETREKIEELLLEHGYSIRKKSETAFNDREIKFVRYFSPKFRSEYTEDFYSGMLMGAERRAHELGLRFGLSSVTLDQLPHTLRSIEKRSDLTGVLFLASELTEEPIPYLLNFSRPIVMIDMPYQLEHHPFNTINMDNYGGISTAVHHLYTMGHRRIGFLRSTFGTGGLLSRYVAFCQIMQALNLEVHPEHIVQLDPWYEVAKGQMAEYLKNQPSLPTAFVAANDALAAGGIYALQQSGVRVPEDVSVIGYDDGTASSFVFPPLTTLHVNRTRIGELAVERLLSLFTTPDDAVVKSTVSVSLVERESIRDIR